MTKCIFCEEIANPACCRRYLPSNWPSDDRILLENEDCIVIPGLGPQVYPYALLLTKRHIQSHLEIKREEYLSIKKILKELLVLDIYRSREIIIFEHGGCEDNTNSCINHFHYHIIDAKYDIYSLIRKNRTIKTYNKKDSKYMYIAKYDLKNKYKAAYSFNNISEKQYFRRILSNMINEKEWDWRNLMNYKYMERLYKNVRSCHPPSLCATEPNSICPNRSTS